MTRYRKWLDEDVLTAARRRVSDAYDQFDSVVVMFSGGKDSQVCVHLALEEARKRGKLPLDVAFRDEEMIPEGIVEHVTRYYHHPEIRLRWYCVPLNSNLVVMGEHCDYVQWDPEREWARQPPPWAILPEDPSIVYGQHVMDEYLARPFHGRVAFIFGLRASESMRRYQSVVMKLHECHIVASSCKRVRLVKPIYDWQENDVFKFLVEETPGYCDTNYDAEYLAGAKLRVSTPLHAESVKHLGVLREWAPDLYEKVQKHFPQATATERLYGEMDVHATVATYAKDGWSGCRRLINERISGDVARSRAVSFLRGVMALANNNPHDYTPEMAAKQILTGSIERSPMADTTMTTKRKAAKAARGE